MIGKYLNGLLMLTLCCVSNADLVKQCAEQQKLATHLAQSCCELTRPSLDKGNAECRSSLNLPKRKFNFAERYTINMCIEECNYIASGYIDIDPPYRLDPVRIEENLQIIMPEPKTKSVKFMTETYSKCEKFRQHHASRFTLHLPDVEFIEQPCNPFALQITICMRIFAMQNCPREFFVNSKECNMTKNYFLNCVGDIGSNLS
ncbi:uncharacterized protein LOC115625063 [Scaptodrosophila lebanonensis]|uniref:Uncharacterized protein LOC115625063 n=1 Tax=Drosophila lebanonensis TaxID=7225 RepID=A0A6J2TLB7_DROLE|nr:uncharacterized protein LOC115625063 [Scaptodrosophila lebanonensis]